MVAVISSLAALQVFNEIYILTGGLGGILNSGVTVVFYLWRKAFRLQEAGMASAVAIVLLVITLVFSMINIRLLERGTEEAAMMEITRPADNTARDDTPPQYEKNRRNFFWYIVL